MQKYLLNSAGMPIKTASEITTSRSSPTCLQPVFGALSDRIGRRTNMLLFGALGAIATVPCRRRSTMSRAQPPLSG